MRKLISVMLLLSATVIASAQKLTIKTANGETVEINCAEVLPAEIRIEGNNVVLKMNNAGNENTERAEASVPCSAPADSIGFATAEQADSADTFVPVGDDEELVATTDSLKNSLVTEENPAEAPSLLNSLAEELSPEYAEFNAQHKDDNPQEVLTNLAKGLIGEEAVENISFVSSLFSGLRFTKDTTFVAKYEQRKPKKQWKRFSSIWLGGTFGQNIALQSSINEQIKEDDYGDDTENEKKIGGDIQINRGYMLGTSDADGNWKPNPLGLALSWGGLVAYSYEKDMGSYFSFMGKAGVQIGQDIVIGADALLGCGITPYNSFYTDGMKHSVINKSVFCFKYGVQLWGSLNYYKNTYTIIKAKYIRSVKPSTNLNLPEGWDLVVEDFDPSSWDISLGVGYRFGGFENLSTDKRLQASISTGYQFAGHQKGEVMSAEIEHLTQVSKSTTLTYGLDVDHLFGQSGDKNNYVSVMFSGGFKVQQPVSRWSWGAKLYAGFGDYSVLFTGGVNGFSLESTSKKLCAKAMLQLNCGYQIGKCSEIFAASRLGYHTGKATKMEGMDSSSYVNLNGFEADARLGYRFTF